MLFRSKGMLDPAELEKIKQVIGSFDYDFSNINLDVETIVEGMKSDKKNQSEKIALILLQGIGNLVLHEEENIEICCPSYEGMYPIIHPKISTFRRFN